MNPHAHGLNLHNYWHPLEIHREKLALQYIPKLQANPGNPAYDVLNPKYQIVYVNKEWVTDSFGMHWKKLLKKIVINNIPDVPISSHILLLF